MRRQRVGGQIRQLADQLADLTHGAVEFLHPQLHGLIDGLRLVHAQAVILHQPVDVKPIAGRGGNAPGGGVRLLKKAQICQLGHLVADGRGGEIHARQRGNGLRADRLGGSDVKIDDRLENFLLSLGKLHCPHLPCRLFVCS